MLNIWYWIWKDGEEAVKVFCSIHFSFGSKSSSSRISHFDEWYEIFVVITRKKILAISFYRSLLSKHNGKMSIERFRREIFSIRSSALLRFHT